MRRCKTQKQHSTPNAARGPCDAMWCHVMPFVIHVVRIAVFNWYISNKILLLLLKLFIIIYTASFVWGFAQHHLDAGAVGTGWSCCCSCPGPGIAWFHTHAASDAGSLQPSAWIFGVFRCMDELCLSLGYWQFDKHVQVCALVGVYVWIVGRIVREQPRQPAQGFEASFVFFYIVELLLRHAATKY